MLPSASFGEDSPTKEYLKLNYGPKEEKPPCFAGDEGSCESNLPSSPYTDELLPRAALGIDKPHIERSLQYANLAQRRSRVPRLVSNLMIEE